MEYGQEQRGTARLRHRRGGFVEAGIHGGSCAAGAELDLSAGADHCTNHLLGYVDLLNPRGMRLQLGPGLGNCLMHYVKNVKPSPAGLVKGLLKHLE